MLWFFGALHSKYIQSPAISHHLHPKHSALPASCYGFQQISQANSVKIYYTELIPYSKWWKLLVSLEMKPNSYSAHPPLSGSPVTPLPTSLTHLSLLSFFLIPCRVHTCLRICSPPWEPIDPLHHLQGFLQKSSPQCNLIWPIYLKLKYASPTSSTSYSPSLLYFFLTPGTALFIMFIVNLHPSLCTVHEDNHFCLFSLSLALKIMPGAQQAFDY